jgi:hypothetical protein
MSMKADVRPQVEIDAVVAAGIAQFGRVDIGGGLLVAGRVDRTIEQVVCRTSGREKPFADLRK